MATCAQWLAAARLRTLPASAAPVLMGVGLVGAIGVPVNPWRSLLALLVALALQVGVNYANDYSDGIRGTDDVGKRVGPVRLTGARLAKPRTVLAAAVSCFAVAGVAGLVLVALAGAWWLAGAGLAAVAAAWFYTGGSRPYGYIGGVAEVLVFVFFGWMATLGTMVTQHASPDVRCWMAASGIGLLSCALLMANNIRDIEGDRRSGKMTLAARLGQRRARAVFVGYIVAASLLALPVTVIGALLVAVAGALVSAPVLGGERGPQLIAALRNTGLLTLGYGLVLALAPLLHLP